MMMKDCFQKGWKQQVESEDLLHPEGKDLGVKKITRKKRKGGEIPKRNSTRIQFMTEKGELTSSRAKNVVFDNLKKKETTIKKF